MLALDIEAYRRQENQAELFPQSYWESGQERDENAQVVEEAKAEDEEDRLSEEDDQEGAGTPSDGYDEGDEPGEESSSEEEDA